MDIAFVGGYGALVTQLTDPHLPRSHARTDARQAAGRAAPPRVLVLDFDGTVCLGDAPVWAYAEAVIHEIGSGASHLADSASAIRGALAAFLRGTERAPRYLDGYAAVAAITDGLATDRQRATAYRASREALATGGLDTHAPAGLGELLAELASTVHRVVVTNAPAAGVRDTLATLGLGDVIDEVITDAHKPDGWRNLLPRLLNGRAPADLLAVGDVWANDIEPLLDAGCCTALVDRFRQNAGPAHLISNTLPDMYDAIRLWAAHPDAFVAAHPPRPIDDPASVIETR